MDNRICIRMPLSHWSNGSTTLPSEGVIGQTPRSHGGLTTSTLSTFDDDKLILSHRTSTGDWVASKSSVADLFNWMSHEWSPPLTVILYKHNLCLYIARYTNTSQTSASDRISQMDPASHFYERYVLIDEKNVSKHSVNLFIMNRLVVPQCTIIASSITLTPVCK